MWCGMVYYGMVFNGIVCFISLSLFYFKKHISDKLKVNHGWWGVWIQQAEIFKVSRPLLNIDAGDI